MTVTVEQTQKILLSNGELYRDNGNFTKKHTDSKVSITQLSRLQNTVGAGDWSQTFVIFWLSLKIDYQRSLPNA